MAQVAELQNSEQMLLPHERIATDQRSIWPWKRWFGRDDYTIPPPSPQEEPRRPGIARRLSRKAIPGLPRPGTFRRQQSELRDNLVPVDPKPYERRAFSVDRRPKGQHRDPSTSTVPNLPGTSAPVLMTTLECFDGHIEEKSGDKEMEADVSEIEDPILAAGEPAESSAPPVDARSVSADEFDEELLQELEKRWILNLSMHFRDKSDREKFFVTFAETPNHWRRVTLSLDYREASEGSLEEELRRMRFQRDKSARIYESIRDSLQDIQFYSTVTNLKLKTEAERLHVHVTEDVHEVIQYPPITAISHLNCRKFREEELIFDSHLSGFVYKVTVYDEVFIKKEIPGPDTVEEFLYEINALHRLSGSDSVIQFGGVIVDNDERHLKGLLISYAEKGALIDIIFDSRGDLPWARRERWAKQIVQGLSEIHEAGFVQGDFTLSNIVIDAEDKAKIIDINRRGCPVGWEPPEVAALIESKQRISMYIGVKSDIFQLGMVLWAIAMQQDEPENHPRPLTLTGAPDEIPSYYRALVGICLSDDPRNRCHATSLLSLFPDIQQDYTYDMVAPMSNHPETQYIDPATAVGRDDIDNFRAQKSQPVELAGPARSSATHTYVNVPTDMSGEPYYYPARGRSAPPRSSRQTPESNEADEYGEPHTVPFPPEYYEPRIVTASPSRHHHLPEIKAGDSEDSVLSEGTIDGPEKPGPAEAMSVEYLVGIGEHSTMEHSEIPQGITDDDLMNDCELTTA